MRRETRMTSNRLTALLRALCFGAIISGFFIAAAPAAHADALGDPAARGGGSANANGGLEAVEEEVKAGEITVGSTNQVVVRFRNNSSREVKIGQINLYPSSTVGAEVALDECGGDKAPALQAGSECAVVVSVKGLKTGNWRVEMLLRHDAKTRIVTSALTGTVVAGDENTDTLLSDLETIPSELDFGTMSSSRPLVKSVILRNVTSVPVNVKKVSIDASEQSGYSLASDCSKLEVGEACISTITWSPLAKGQSDGVLVVEHDGPTKVASVNLKGSYDPKDVEKANMFPEAIPGAGLMVSSQEEIDFGSITNEASMTVSLVNVGDKDMQIKDLSLGSADKGLTIASTGCKKGSVLKPVEACALTLDWSPVRSGELLEDVRIHHDGVRGVLVLPVRGSAESAVNRDSKAVVVDDQGMTTKVIETVDKKQALEGFVITSHSKTKAIINGPGGSRVVSDNQDLVLGGVEWKVDIIDTGVEFLNGKDRVRLLFDKSLSNSGSSSSGGGSTSSSGGGATTSSSDSGTTTTTTAATSQ